MDMEHDSQSLSNRQNGNLPQSVPQFYPGKPNPDEGQALDLTWLFGVVRRRAPLMAGVAIALSAITGGLIIYNSRHIPAIYEGFFRVLIEPATAEGRLAKLSSLAQTAGATGATDITKLRVEDSDLVDYETQIRVLKSPKLMQPVVQQMQATYPDITYNLLMSKLLISRVSYEKDGKQTGTKILDVRYQDKNPEKIKFVLNKLSQAYLDYSFQERLTSLRQGIGFIDEQLPELQKRVDTLQGQLQSLRQKYSLSVPEQTGKYLSDQAQVLASQRVDIQSQLAERKSTYTTLERQLKEAKSTSILSREAQTYRTLIEQLQQVEAELASQKAVFQDDSPPIQSLIEKRQNLRLLLQREAANILDNVAGQIKELEARSQVISQREQVINQQLAEYPNVLRRYDDLQRQLELGKDTLKLFLEKREALKLDAAQREIPWELISPAALSQNEDGTLTPALAKQTKRQLAIAGLLSILLGIGAGFIAEIMQTVFHTPEELKATTRLPVLGVIPFAKKLKQLTRKSKQVAPNTDVTSLNPSESSLLLQGNSHAEEMESAFFLESFRSLYTNIRLLSAAKPIRSLTITSAVPGDGKSTVALYLAQTAAAIGQRVLLVDADLRRPQMHTRLGLPNVQGLSEAIATDLSLNDAIQRSPLEENLFVLTAGQIHSDPIKLFSSEKMQYLMEQFQAFFDLVIYDTPPLMGLADGNIIAAHTEGVVMVVGLQKTDRPVLLKALEELRISGASVLGIVANGIKGYTPSSYATYHRYYRSESNLNKVGRS
jgi:succinoglycan biosynthesis transport protein ExoP